MVMGIVTTGIISFTLIAVNIGFSDTFLNIWLKSWGLAYVVVIPAILILGPLIQKFVDNMLSKKE